MSDLVRPVRRTATSKASTRPARQTRREDTAHDKAGDSVLVLTGPEKGQTLAVTSVRMFASDPGYYLRGGSGLYTPGQVQLAAERADGNPCGSVCDPAKHDALGTCDHCRGTCTELLNHQI